MSDGGHFYLGFEVLPPSAQIMGTYTKSLQENPEGAAPVIEPGQPLPDFSIEMLI